MIKMMVIKMIIISVTFFKDKGVEPKAPFFDSRKSFLADYGNVIL